MFYFVIVLEVSYVIWNYLKSIFFTEIKQETKQNKQIHFTAIIRLIISNDFRFSQLFDNRCWARSLNKVIALQRTLPGIFLTYFVIHTKQGVGVRVWVRVVDLVRMWDESIPPLSSQTVHPPIIYSSLSSWVNLHE
jgi:hypothetical protein